MGFEIPASSLSLRNDSRALRRWSRMKPPRSCSRVSIDSNDSVLIPRVPATCRSAISRSIASMTSCICAARSDSSRSNARSASSVDVELVERRAPAGSRAWCRRRAPRDRRASAARWSADRPRAAPGCRRSANAPTPRSGSAGDPRRDPRRCRRARAALSRPRGSRCEPARAAGSTRVRARPRALFLHRAELVERNGSRAPSRSRDRVVAGCVPSESLPDDSRMDLARTHVGTGRTSRWRSGSGYRGIPTGSRGADPVRASIRR